jgi:predicted metalloprotease with PDZ domain
VLREGASDGDTRARAVVVLLEIDAGIRESTDDEKSLDDVVRVLADRAERITTAKFRAVVAEVAGRDLGSIFDEHAPEPS